MLKDFRGKKHWAREWEGVMHKYGPVVTLSLGNRPVVFINDIDIARDALRKNDMPEDHKICCVSKVENH